MSDALRLFSLHQARLQEVLFHPLHILRPALNELQEVDLPLADVNKAVEFVRQVGKLVEGFRAHFEVLQLAAFVGNIPRGRQTEAPGIKFDVVYRGDESESLPLFGAKVTWDDFFDERLANGIVPA